MARLEEPLISQYNEMSIEDQRFLKMANKAVLKDGHYNLNLPFRKIFDVCMPSNRQIAEQRLQSLKQKTKKDEQYKQEYVAFSMTCSRITIQRRSHRKNSHSHLQRYGIYPTMGCTTLKKKIRQIRASAGPGSVQFSHWSYSEISQRAHRNHGRHKVNVPSG